MSIVMEDPPKAREFTPEDLLQMPGQGQGYELVDGELRELNVSFLSSYVAGEIHGVLREHVRARRLGWVSPEGTSYRCFPDRRTIRRADTAFHQLARLTIELATSEGFCSVVPDLVVEVISPHDAAYDIEEKRGDWLEAGAKLVWEVYPVTKRIYAFRPEAAMRLFGPNDTLDADPALPEFRVAVADLFQLPAQA
jgi:Uma2 family endonuclease